VKPVGTIYVDVDLYLEIGGSNHLTTAIAHATGAVSGPHHSRLNTREQSSVQAVADSELSW
jgi:hypothetical protein